MPINPTDNFDFAASAARILSRCDTLAGFTEEPGRITRTFLSAPMRDVHRVVGAWMADAGLSARVDAVGAIVGESEGPADGPVFLLGSHLDTIRDAGRYDGILGVLMAIEAAGIVRQFGTLAALPFALHVAGFSEEEGVRFPPYISSRAVAGSFAPELLDLRDDAGKSLREAIADFGLDPAKIPDAAYAPGRLIGYAEVHIEQGPRLEDAGRAVAAVDAIAGQSRMLLRVAGHAGHAGTTPMPLRRDALAGAAELILAIESLARETVGLAGTVGFVECAPNISNVIPGEIGLSLDMRHKDESVRMSAVADLRRFGAEIAARRGLRFAVERERQFPPVPMDAAMTSAMRTAIEAVTGADAPVFTSGAGHDASIFAPIAPTTMLFVRSPNGGLSHHPDESVLPGDVETALRVLVEFINRLAGESLSWQAARALKEPRDAMLQPAGGALAPKSSTEQCTCLDAP